MAEWKPRPPPPPPPAAAPPPVEAPPAHQHPHYQHQHHHLPPPFRQHPPPHHPGSPTSPPHRDSLPPHQQARPSDHGSPIAKPDYPSPPLQHLYKPASRRDSSPMRHPRPYPDDAHVSHSPGAHAPHVEAYHGHPPPPPAAADFHRRRSDMDVHPGSYRPPQTLEEHMREQQMHSVTPPGHAYAPHHLDTSVGAAYGPHSQPHSAPAYQPYPYSGYDTPNGAAQDSAQKRKAVRASQACDNCRAKKAKCDENKPCGNCVANNVVCHFRDVQPPKQERSMLQLTDTVTQLSQGFQTLEGRMQEFQNVLVNVAQRLDAGNPLSNDQPPKHPQYSPAQNLQNPPRARSSDYHAPSQSSHEERQQGSYSGHNFKAEPPESRRWNQTGGSPGRSDFASVRESPGLPEDSDELRELVVSRDLERRREEAQLDMLNGNVSVAPRHFTAANHLADWPSISPNFANIARRDYVKRGEHYHSLCLRSVIQRAAKPEPGGNTGPAGSPATHSEHDDSSTISNLSDGRPALAFVKQGTEGSKGSHPTPGGRNPRDQSLSIDKETSIRLLNSYMEKMHIQQPFLSKDYVNSLLEQFIASYCSEPAAPFSPFAVIDSSIERPDSRGPSHNVKRRKYSQGPGNDTSHPKTASPKIPIERTVENALILLIFALGKACGHEGPLPALTGEVKTVPVGTPVPMGVTSTPLHQNGPAARRSPALAMTSFSQGPDNSKARRMHDEFSATSEPRGSDPYSQDIDRVPGLAYYIHAVQILGEVHGENSLTNVQAQLLAGLYMGQLLRVNDSYRWICSACMTWQMLFKQRDDEVRDISEDERTTFWACLVLESDIVAEHDCIQSGISKWEDQMRYPKMEDDLDDAELECKVYFLAQIAIRKILNRAHSALYTLEEDKQKNQEWQRLSFRDLTDQLEAWRRGLPRTIQWEDSAPLPSTINAARLRGKYWGARYVIFRNYLRDVMHPNSTPEQQNRQSAHDDADYKTQFEKETEAIRRAVQCIEAAKASTVSFDGIPTMLKRLIVTNPFGTAQAQFSNILVLSAAFNASPLHGHVPQHDILALIDRTYEFLSNVAHLSPTMNTNLRVLERCRYRVLHGGSLPNSAKTSFVS